MSKSLYNTGAGAHLKHKVDGREFGLMVHQGLIDAHKRMREVKIDLMAIMEDIDVNGSNTTKQEIKQRLFDLYKKVK